MDLSRYGVCGPSVSETCLDSTFGNCCSQWGFCGANSSYCGNGCLPEYGLCYAASASARTTTQASTSSLSASSSISFSTSTSSAISSTIQPSSSSLAQASTSLSTSRSTSILSQTLPASTSPSTTSTSQSSPSTITQPVATSTGSISPGQNMSISAFTIDRTDLLHYTIPFGAIGFISHIFLFFTFISLSSDATPLTFPWWLFRRPKHWILALLLMGCSIIVQVVVIIASLARCRHNVPLRLIAVMHLGSATMLFYLTLRIALLARRADPSPLQPTGEMQEAPLPPEYSTAPPSFVEPSNVATYATSTDTSIRTPWQAPRWQVAQGLTLACGIAGVLYLTVQGWADDSVKAVSMVFLPLFLILAVCIVILHLFGFSPEMLVEMGLYGGETKGNRIAHHLWYLTIVTFAFLSDWLLAVTADDLVGLRYGKTDAGLYWAFFVARLLPLFVF